MTRIAWPSFTFDAEGGIAEIQWIVTNYNWSPNEASPVTSEDKVFAAAEILASLTVREVASVFASVRGMLDKAAVEQERGNL